MDYDSIDYFFDDASSFHAGKPPIHSSLISDGNFYAVLPSKLTTTPCRSFFHVELDDILRLPCVNKQDAERITTQYIRLWSRFQGNHSFFLYATR